MDASPELRASASGDRGSFPAAVTGLVRSLSIAVVLQWAGAGAILPLLPLYVKDHGGSDAVVGAVMAAYFATAFVFQYGAGRMSDRLGRLPVLVAGLLVYAGGSFLFLVPGPAALDIVFRALQGAGAGGAMVASLAMLAHAVPLSYRGRASGRIYGAQLGGLAVGPVLGSLAGVDAMRWLFLAAGVVSVGAIVPVLRAGRLAAEVGEVGEEAAPAPDLADHAALSDTGLGGTALPDTGPPDTGSAPGPAPAEPAAGTLTGEPWTGGWRLPRTTAGKAVWGALAASASIGLTTGVYESCWTLLMTHLGAATWQIGVSWTLFALPFALMSRPAGWLADHFDRRWLGIAALVWTVGFCAGYPFVPAVPLLMVLGIWESAGFALALPATQSLLGEGTTPERHGHVQGLFAASQTGATAVAAAAAGGLFGVAPWMPFELAAGSCAVLVGLVALCWRGVPGRVRRVQQVQIAPLDAAS